MTTTPHLVPGLTDVDPAELAQWRPMLRLGRVGVHEFLDVVVANAQDAADTVAERIVALGLPVDARIGTVAARTSTPELTPGFQQSSVVVREVVEQIDATLRTVYEAVDALEDIDAVSQDVVIAVAQQLDKDRWFLFSHFAE